MSAASLLSRFYTHYPCRSCSTCTPSSVCVSSSGWSHLSHLWQIWPQWLSVSRFLSFSDGSVVNVMFTAGLEIWAVTSSEKPNGFQACVFKTPIFMLSYASFYDCLWAVSKNRVSSKCEFIVIPAALWPIRGSDLTYGKRPFQFTQVPNHKRSIRATLRTFFFLITTWNFVHLQKNRCKC